MSRESVVRVDGLHYLVARKGRGGGSRCREAGALRLCTVVTDSCLSEELQLPVIMVDRLERRQGRKEEKDSEYRSLSPRGRLRRNRPDSSLQTLSSQLAFGR